jgi:hypothetical protein
MSTMRGFDAAQRAYDNMLPPEPGPHECDTCKGRGKTACPTCEGNGCDESGDTCIACNGEETAKCTDCTGTGWLNGDGEPCSDPSDGDREDDGDNAWFHDPDMGDR